MADDDVNMIAEVFGKRGAGLVLGQLTPIARQLIDDVGPLLDSQAESTEAIRTWARSLAGVTDS